MATCELCGKDADLQRVTIESARVKACPDCANTASTENTDTATQTTETRSRTPPDPGPTIAPNYGERVRNAREAENLSQAELANQLNVKESVVRRVENEELVPDADLAATLEQALNITLYEERSPGRDTVAASSTATTQNGEAATIGDVTDIDTA